MKKKCKHEWRLSRFVGNCWGSYFQAFEKCSKCEKTQYRDATLEELSTQQKNYACRLCGMSHPPSDAYVTKVEDCLLAMGERIQKLEKETEKIKILEDRVKRLEAENRRTMPFVRRLMPIGGSRR